MYILILIYLVFIGVGLPDSLLGTAWPFMSADLQQSVDRAGNLSIMISVGIILASLAAYHIVQKIGFWRSMAAALLSMTIALCGYACSGSLWMLIGFSLLLGFGCGMLQTLSNDYVAENYSSRQMSWLHGTWGIGAVAGPLIVSALHSLESGWRISYFIVAGLELLLLCGILFVSYRQKETPSEAALPRESGTEKTKSHINGKPFLIGQFFCYCSMENSVMLWGASYLIAAKQMDAAVAARGVSFFFLGITAGRFLAGILMKKLGNMKMIYASVAVSVVLDILLLCIGNELAVMAVFLLLGCSMASIYPAMMHQTPTFFQNANIQQVMGIQVASAYVGILIIPPVLGKLCAWISFQLFPVIEAIFLTGVAICVTVLAGKNRGKRHSA